MPVRSHAVFAVALLAPLVLAGCGEEEPDAYGNFEAEEVVVSAEAGGQLLRFEAEEGVWLPAGAVVGLLDTTQVVLQLRELEAQLAAARSQTGQATAQTGALEAQLRLAESELARTLRLFEDQAATLQQLEQARSQVAVLREQIQAARAQTSGSEEQATALVARIAQLRDRLRKSRITNPVGGTVLTTYAEAGEFVQLGQPLYEIADLDTMILRAYVTGAQLPRVRLGEPVRVAVDAGEDDLRAFPGIVSWISSEAEFTPTPIQTREERTDLVYAIEVRVANPNGFLKIGMPGEVEFAPVEEEDEVALLTNRDPFGRITSPPCGSGGRRAPLERHLAGGSGDPAGAKRRGGSATGSEPRKGCAPAGALPTTRIWPAGTLLTIRIPV